jgi:hypothetical protein
MQREGAGLDDLSSDRVADIALEFLEEGAIEREGLLWGE